MSGLPTAAPALEPTVHRRRSFAVQCRHATMAKNVSVRLDEDLAADTEALARAEGLSLNETIKQALKEVVARRSRDPAFKVRLRRIIDEDRELSNDAAK